MTPGLAYPFKSIFQSLILTRDKRVFSCFHRIGAKNDNRQITITLHAGEEGRVEC